MKDSGLPGSSRGRLWTGRMTRGPPERALRLRCEGQRGLGESGRRPRVPRRRNAASRPSVEPERPSAGGFAPVDPHRRPRVPDRRPCPERCTFHSQAGPPGTGAPRRQTTKQRLTSSQATRRAPCGPGSDRELGRCLRFVLAALVSNLPLRHSTQIERGPQNIRPRTRRLGQRRNPPRKRAIPRRRGGSRLLPFRSRARQSTAFRS